MENADYEIFCNGLRGLTNEEALREVCKIIEELIDMVYERSVSEEDLADHMKLTKRFINLFKIIISLDQNEMFKEDNINV